ncbi:MAG: DUF4062 domain-containing protein [Gammaproteobacteria bacterium]|jgi:hypothetical protein|nr:DUF4062 domain-containing protein [Gammaproteobacteria bacterium]
MARLKVFISSTCYDLSVVRSQIRTFVQHLGHEPVMSDFNEVLFDPREHTHKSCLQEVGACDAVVLIIGSRFGGTGVPSAFDELDVEALSDLSSSSSVLDSKQKLSITQLEICKAIQDSIPVFAFVDNRVMHDHSVYEANKSAADVVDAIKFPSIEKPETAKYIFEFINFLRHRSEGNSVISFSKVEDISEYLGTQWSSLFQRLLYEDRNRDAERRRIDLFSSQIEDLRAAIMSSIQAPDLRQTASGAIRYRRLIDFVRSLEIPGFHNVLMSTLSWEDVMQSADIVETRTIHGRGPVGRRTALVKSDGTYYEVRFPLRILQELAVHWGSFIELNQDSRRAIIDAVTESSSHGMMQVRYVNEVLASQDELDIDESDEDIPF